MMRFKFRAIAASILLFATSAHGQLLFDFESGLQDWGISGFGNGTEAVGLSAFGATEGSAQALSMSHSNGDFSWDASWVSGDMGNSVYQALSAAAASPAGKTIEFDFTFSQNGLPTFVDFSNVTFSLQSDAGFKQVSNVAGIGGTAMDATFHVALPLDSGDLAGTTPNSSFYRLTFGPNVNAGGPTSTWYVDNIRIVPEPASAGLLGFGVMALIFRRRR